MAGGPVDSVQGQHHDDPESAEDERFAGKRVRKAPHGQDSGDSRRGRGEDEHGEAKRSHFAEHSTARVQARSAHITHVEPAYNRGTVVDRLHPVMVREGGSA